MGCGSLVGVTESGGLCGCYGVYVVLIVELRDRIGDPD